MVPQSLGAQGARLDSLLGPVLAMAPVGGPHVTVEAFGSAVGACCLLAVAIRHTAVIRELALVSSSLLLDVLSPEIFDERDEIS